MGIESYHRELGEILGFPECCVEEFLTIHNNPENSWMNKQTVTGFPSHDRAGLGNLGNHIALFELIKLSNSNLPFPQQSQHGTYPLKALLNPVTVCLFIQEFSGLL